LPFIGPLGRSTIDVIAVIRMSMEKYWEKQRTAHGIHSSGKVLLLSPMARSVEMYERERGATEICAVGTGYVQRC
jgi:hypothetical protein